MGEAPKYYPVCFHSHSSKKAQAIYKKTLTRFNSLISRIRVKKVKMHHHKALFADSLLYACFNTCQSSSKHIQSKQSKRTNPNQSQLLDLLAKQEIQLHHCSMPNNTSMTWSKPGSQVSLCHESLHTSINQEQQVVSLNVTLVYIQ